jgi:hypothetical protein
MTVVKVGDLRWRGSERHSPQAPSNPGALRAPQLLFVSDSAVTEQCKKSSVLPLYMQQKKIVGCRLSAPILKNKQCFTS